MPIFEYQCNNCNSRYEILHKSLSSKDKVFCPQCSSKDFKKLISTFSSADSNSSDFPGPNCAAGNCDTPSYGGCSSGMCGLN
jgi:putative FmdB family regulatory protein